MLPEFKAALIEAHENPDAPQPGCLEQADIFSDYTTLPSAEEAEYLCAPCPLLELCLANARRVKPHWTVQGGLAWVRGRPASSHDPKDLEVILDEIATQV